MPSSISTYRAVLHVVLENACDTKKITDNSTRRKRNRGRRAGWNDAVTTECPAYRPNRRHMSSSDAVE